MLPAEGAPSRAVAGRWEPLGLPVGVFESGLRPLIAPPPTPPPAGLAASCGPRVLGNKGASGPGPAPGFRAGGPGGGSGLCGGAGQKGRSAGPRRMCRVLCLGQPRSCSRPRFLHPAPSRKTSGGVLRLEAGPRRGEAPCPPSNWGSEPGSSRARWWAGPHPSPAAGLRMCLAKPLSAARQGRDDVSDHFPVRETEAQRANALIWNLRAPGFTCLCPHLDVDGQPLPSYLGWCGTAALCRLWREPRARCCRRPR